MKRLLGALGIACILMAFWPSIVFLDGRTEDQLARELPNQGEQRPNIVVKIPTMGDAWSRILLRVGFPIQPILEADFLSYSAEAPTTDRQETQSHSYVRFHFTLAGIKWSASLFFLGVLLLAARRWVAARPPAEELGRLPRS